MSDSLICSFLVSEPLFCHEQPERFAHIALLKRGNEQIPHFFNLQKTYKNTILFKNIWANCSFFVSERANEGFAQKKSNSLIRSFALLSWATWANRSRSLFCHATWVIHLRSLFCHERPERFAQSGTFVLSNLSKSLTVAHWNERFWANERWANERIPNPGKVLLFCYLRKGRSYSRSVRLASGLQITTPPADWRQEAV